MELLHRHPAEVCLSPYAYTELMAMQEMREAPVCDTCLAKHLQAKLKATCTVCGHSFEDRVVRNQLENL